ncbi:AraC family ligand binding domain-containing protein [Blastococcus sp. SYSU DS1024]
MRRVRLSAREITAFGSRGVVMVSPARVGEPVAGFGVHLATFAAGAVVGRHETRLWQLFAVVSGAGWAAGADGGRVPLATGDAVLWEPGELHESGSDAGMVAVVVESPVVPVPDEG